MLSLWHPGLKQIVPSLADKYCCKTRCGKTKTLRNHLRLDCLPARPEPVHQESDYEVCERFCPVAV